MEIKVKDNFVKSTPRKLRLVASILKTQKAVTAEAKLGLINKSAALPLRKSLTNALSIVKERGLDPEKFTVKEVRCDQGPRLKRRIYKSRGQATLVQKRMSHITIIIADTEKIEEKKSKETKIDRVDRKKQKSDKNLKVSEKPEKEIIV